jgi:hypothetical protein
MKYNNNRLPFGIMYDYTDEIARLLGEGKSYDEIDEWFMSRLPKTKEGEFMWSKFPSEAAATMVKNGEKNIVLRLMMNDLEIGKSVVAHWGRKFREEYEKNGGHLSQRVLIGRDGR